MKIYHRWLLSYLPAFLAIVSILIFLFFTAMGNYSKQQAVKANEVFAQNALQTVDSLLQFSEQMIIKEILTNEKIRLFFDGGQWSDPYENYEVSQRVRDLSSYLLSIDSIYLYRASDQVVLTPNTMIQLDQFADHSFVEYANEADSTHSWSEIRTFREFQGDGSPQKKVVSLWKNIPLGTGVQGLIVANVRISKLEEAIRDLLDSDLNFLALSDAKGMPILGGIDSANKVLSKVTSAYTGWTIQSGFKQSNTFGYFASISKAWYAAVLLSVLAGIVWLFLAARKHYRPIQLIESSIRLYTERKLNETSSGERQDEFHFIRTAIDGLVEYSRDYEKKVEESVVFRRKLLFKRIMEDAEPPLAEEWDQEMERFELSDRIIRIAVIVFEIDRYDAVFDAYSSRDQNLLKFVVSAAVGETGQQKNMRVWCEWMSQKQLGVMIMAEDEHMGEIGRLQPFCKSIRQWIEQNLPFTVSCGIGSMIDNHQHISRSYLEALEALQYTSIYGSNATISYEEITTPPQGHALQYGEQIRLTAQAFRTGDPRWEEQLHDLFAVFVSAVLKREDAIDCINYFIFALDKECKSLPLELWMIWEQEALPEIRDNVRGFIKIAEVEKPITQILTKLLERFQLQKQKRESHKLILQIKEYIETHYYNPDLSLIHVSETFQLHMKSVSRLFKEEFGENFVDYVAKVRLEQAKRLLNEENSDSVQEIARKVGYTHAITFIRVFKKWVGTTPGDYRKSNRNST
ncbi:helix-turn-helix domain-containing protein [Paenibacillus eucommiae]|uniref:AraC-like DNA-binding protein n=1 Tax=Paenibacillus eucommiae TaxID=1355755 RepID=A0ABS4JAE8_9BACL|nr:helix-turn-helix domain-containing protein [Paenibacillus eucommiae]MBP1996812.1 AraC-like DNA-binding protein [Paenibacillus eucommiae]